MSKCADCNELVGEEWSANNGLCTSCARDEASKADTNQASEDEKLAKLFHDTYERLAPAFSYKTRKASAVHWADVPPNNKGLMIAVAHEINESIRNEKIKLLDEVIHQSTVNLKSAKAVSGWAEIRKKQLEAEL